MNVMLMLKNINRTRTSLLWILSLFCWFDYAKKKEVV